MGKIQNVCSKVVGVTFNNPDGSSRQDIIRHVDKQDIIMLVREPDNPYDKYAVKVMTLYGQVGYIGKEYTEIIAPMMDSGIAFSARINEVDEYKKKMYMSIIIDQV